MEGRTIADLVDNCSQINKVLNLSSALDIKDKVKLTQAAAFDNDRHNTRIQLTNYSRIERVAFGTITENICRIHTHSNGLKSDVFLNFSASRLYVQQIMKSSSDHVDCATNLKPLRIALAYI